MSYNTLVRLKMHSSGKLILGSRSSTEENTYVEHWSTDTNMKEGSYAGLHSNGQLVLKRQNKTLWSSHSPTGTAPFRLVVSDDVAAYILDSSNNIVWSTNPWYSGLITFFTESFDDNNAQLWNVDNGNISLPSFSAHCPNYPDACAQVRYEDTGDCQVRVNQAISMFDVVLLQVDIAGFSLDNNHKDACQIEWRISTHDLGGYDSGGIYNTLYPEGVYKDVIIEIPLQDPHLYIRVDFELDGSASSDQCFFDNVIFRGVSTLNPTPVPTRDPTHPTTAPTHPTHTTHKPTYKSTSTTSREPTRKPTARPSPNPIKEPTYMPTHEPTKRQNAHSTTYWTSTEVTLVSTPSTTGNASPEPTKYSSEHPSSSQNQTPEPTSLTTKRPTSTTIDKDTTYIPTPSPTASTHNANTPSPTTSTSFVCGTSDIVGEYNGLPLEFTVLMQHPGDITFDMTYSTFTVTLMEAFHSDDQLETDYADDPIIHLTNMPMGSYVFKIHGDDHGEPGGTYDVRTTCITKSPTPGIMHQSTDPFTTDATPNPTISPSSIPSNIPSQGPLAPNPTTFYPTSNPTNIPSHVPIISPTASPTTRPTNTPSLHRHGSTAQPSDNPSTRLTTAYITDPPLVIIVPEATFTTYTSQTYDMASDREEMELQSQLVVISVACIGSLICICCGVIVSCYCRKRTPIELKNLNRIMSISIGNRRDVMKSSCNVPQRDRKSGNHVDNVELIKKVWNSAMVPRGQIKAENVICTADMVDSGEEGNNNDGEVECTIEGRRNNDSMSDKRKAEGDVVYPRYIEDHKVTSGETNGKCVFNVDKIMKGSAVMTRGQ